MAGWLAAGRVSRRRLGEKGSDQVSGVVSSWNVDVPGGEQVAGGPGDLGALPEGADRAGEGADADALQFAAHGRPGLPGVVLGDADEQEGEPAQDDVGADALFEPVVDGPQVQEDPSGVIGCLTSGATVRE